MWGLTVGLPMLQVFVIELALDSFDNSGSTQVG
jgi:hypothetical protein